MEETEFYELIDCEFPYNNRERAIELIDLGISISANASFAVLHELCRPGMGTDVTKETLLDLIAIWVEKVNHPLAISVVPVARMMAEGKEQPVDEAILLLLEIAPYEGLYAALNIAYFSCDDTNGGMEVAYEEVVDGWEAA